MDKFKSLEGKVKAKDDWEVVRDLSKLSDMALMERIKAEGDNELIDLRTILIAAEGVGEGQAGVDAAHGYAERAGMTYEEYLSAIDRIMDCLHKLGY